MGVKRSADLESAVQAALDAAAQTGETQWAGLQAEFSPCDVLAAFEASESRDRFYWERPSEGRSIAAFGCAAAIEAEGEGRFSEASKRAEQLFSRLHVFGHGTPSTAGPFLVGGFAFSNLVSTEPCWREFPTGRLVLPEVAIAVSGGQGWCTLVQPVRCGVRVRTICDELRAGLDEVGRSLGQSQLDRCVERTDRGNQRSSRLSRVCRSNPRRLPRSG